MNNALHEHDPLPTGWRVPWTLGVLALPIIAAMVSRTAMSFIDFVMVSKLGTEAQAAIGPAQLVVFCCISFCMGLVTSVATYVSQSLGRREWTNCSAYGWQGVWLSLLMGLAALPAWFGVGPLFAWVGHAPAVAAMETDYARIALLSLGPATAGCALANYYQGIHQPAVGWWSALIANVLNVAGNYALIYGHWGCPALGIAGAAWATTAASTLQTLIMLAWMIRPAAHRQFQSHATWRWNARKIWELIKLGLPAGLHFTSDIITWSIFTLWLVGRFGTEQLAAHNVVFKFLEISFMPTVGLGAAVTAAVGKAIGHGRPDHARLVTRWATMFAVGYMGLIAACYLVFRMKLPGLLTDDPQVVSWASKLLLCCAIFQVFDALGITHVSALRGAGDVHWPAYLAIGYGVTLFLGGSFLIAWLRPQWQALGPWSVATVYIMLLGVTFWIRWLRGSWESIQLLPTMQGEETGRR
ncbi:MAG: MATE family efflux transporter [Phycisphaeraceae bacterium]|nr:MATE family efflux transporter [Phycisphaeraceae bacterium]